MDRVDPTLTKEYSLERYKNGEVDAKNNNYKKPDFEEAKSKPVFREKISLESIESLPEEHFAKTYVRSRRIPEKFYSQLFFAPDFRKFVQELGIDKEGLKEGDQRLVIPFYDENKNLIAFQGRALGESKLRYITVKTSEDNSKVFGLDRIDQDKTIYVVEGPIDSMFLDNAVATADSNLRSITSIYDKSKVVLIFDNEPRNKDVVTRMEKLLERGYKVAIWPDKVLDKDINDMILSGLNAQDIEIMLDVSTVTGLEGKLKLSYWRKC